MAISRAVELGGLVGAQLSALIEAEVEGAERTAQYIEEVGFRKIGVGASEKLELLTVSFDMNRRDADGTVRTHTIRVPVLTLMQIPMLTIEEANIELDLLVEEVVDVEEPTTRTARRVGHSLSRKKKKLKGRLARTSKADSSVRSDLKVSVRVGQSDFPAGIGLLLNAAELSVEDEVEP